MAEIKLSSPSKAEVMLDGGLIRHHETLRNLDFENSGHTGFQKQLTESQLLNIDAVSEKENTANKTTRISSSATNEQYPSAKAVFDAIEGHGDFELVKSDELEQNVAQMILNLNDQYKEIYLRFTIPSSGKSSTNKARFRLQTANDNKTIYDMGSTFISDYAYEWYAVFHIKMYGDYCRTDLWYGDTSSLLNAYAKGMSSSTYNGYVAPSTKLPRDYIDRLKISFNVSGGVNDVSIRYLPAGTTFELWGVRK